MPAVILTVKMLSSRVMPLCACLLYTSSEEWETEGEESEEPDADGGSTEEDDEDSVK